MEKMHLLSEERIKLSLKDTPNEHNPTAIDNAKKLPESHSLDLSTISLKELKLDKDIENRLFASGYVTIGDIVPNCLKQDLIDNALLNRKSRREIEARLKAKRIALK